MRERPVTALPGVPMVLILLVLLVLCGLQRQQAAAIIAARTRIVEGAVTMVHMALEQLARKDVVHLDG